MLNGPRSQNLGVDNEELKTTWYYYNDQGVATPLEMNHKYDVDANEEFVIFTTVSNEENKFNVRFSNVLGHICPSTELLGKLPARFCTVISNIYWNAVNTESPTYTNPDEFAGGYLLGFRQQARRFSEFSSQLGSSILALCFM